MFIIILRTTNDRIEIEVGKKINNRDAVDLQLLVPGAKSVGGLYGLNASRSRRARSTNTKDVKEVHH